MTGHVPLCSALARACKFGVLAFSFPFISKYFLVRLLICSLTHWLFISVLNLHIVVSFPNYSVTSDLIFLWIPSSQWGLPPWQPYVILNILNIIYIIFSTEYNTVFSFVPPTPFTQFYLSQNTYHYTTYHIMYYVYFHFCLFLTFLWG